MKFSLWTQYGALNSKPVFEALEYSLIQAKHNVVKNDLTADVHVIWSVLWNGRMTGNKQVWEHAKRQNKNVIVLEVGGIKRNVTWKVGLNGINRDAYFGPDGMDDSRAIQQGLSLKPWRKQGEHILICGQHEKSLQWRDMPRMSHWVMHTIEEIQRHTNRPIVFRPHPRCRLEAIEHQYQNVYRDDPVKLMDTYDDYNLTFRNAHAVVSYSSNPGIHSVLEGVPAFVSTHSLAYDAANDIDFLHDIENPYKPERQQWLNDYAWTEYTVEEIAAGIPLKRLTDKL